MKIGPCPHCEAKIAFENKLVRTKKGSVTPLHINALTVIEKITVPCLRLLIMSEEALVIHRMMLI